MEMLAAFFLACVFGLGMAIGGIMAKLSKASDDDAREPKAPEPHDDGRNNTNESRARFPVDIELRRAGFEIVARIEGREPIWRLGKVEFRESEAVKRAMEHDSYALSGVHVG